MEGLWNVCPLSQGKNVMENQTCLGLSAEQEVREQGVTCSRENSLKLNFSFLKGNLPSSTQAATIIIT